MPYLGMRDRSYVMLRPAYHGRCGTPGRVVDEVIPRDLVAGQRYPEPAMALLNG